MILITGGVTYFLRKGDKLSKPQNTRVPGLRTRSQLKRFTVATPSLTLVYCSCDSFYKIYIYESWLLCFFFCHILSFVYQYYPLFANFAYCNYSYIQWNTFYTLEAQTYDLQLQVGDAGFRFEPPGVRAFSLHLLQLL